MRRHGGTVSTRPIDGSAYFDPGVEHAQVGGKRGGRVGHRPAEEVPRRKVVSVGVLEGAVLLDRENLLARGENGVEVGGREVGQPRPLPAERDAGDG